MNLEAIGKMSDLQDEITPLQVGTFGRFDNEKFEVIGRLKVGYQDGFWNEWLAYFGGDKTGWLAEAQGFYAMCFPVEPSVQLPDVGTMKPGLAVSLNDVVFEVDDIEDAWCVFSEGELPVAAVKGRAAISVDLSTLDGGMATIEYAKGSDELRAFVGRYQEFDEFHFTNLRHLDGW